MNKIRIVFMGTSDFAASILRGLLDAKYIFQAVYTQPARASGRGHCVIQTPVHTEATRAGIPVNTPENLIQQAAQEKLRSLEPDLILVAAYGLLLPQSVLNIPPYGCVNVHGSLLPRFRGAAPVQYAILEGDHETGISLMKMDAGMDTGPVFARIPLVLHSDDTTASVMKRLADKSVEGLVRYLPDYVSGECIPIPQPTTGIVYAPKILKEAGRLNFSTPAVRLERQVRAFTPSPGTWFFHHEQRIKVLKATTQDDTHYDVEQWGQIQGTQLEIATSQGLFCPQILQRPGGNPMTVAAFLRGYALPCGTVLQSFPSSVNQHP